LAAQATRVDSDVIGWLLDSDPSIRWQVMRDLADAPADEVIPVDHLAGRMPVETDESEGQPSRWNTLRALRVLNWYSGL
jgi:hypothetical protein